MRFIAEPVGALGALLTTPCQLFRPPLDFGDYAMAVSLFKRALGALNGSLALLNADPVAGLRHVHAWREEALPQFFDLREVWLRFISECREELDRPVDEES